jgi:hypothetical protein
MSLLSKEISVSHETLRGDRQIREIWGFANPAIWYGSEFMIDSK